MSNSVMTELVSRLQEFIVNEARSCSMDFGCITSLYVFRMWGGQVSMEDIENGLTEIRNQGTFMVHGSSFMVSHEDN